MTMTPRELLERLRSAVDDHDVEAVVVCFTPDYRNETPVHPARSFDGQEQVRKNWTRIFARIPDVTARVLRTAVNGDAVWSEWELGGNGPDGVPQRLRGVIIFGMRGERFAWARFYLEPVDASASGVDAAVSRLVEGRDR